MLREFGPKVVELNERDEQECEAACYFPGFRLMGGNGVHDDDESAANIDGGTTQTGHGGETVELAIRSVFSRICDLVLQAALSGETDLV